AEAAFNAVAGRMGLPWRARWVGLGQAAEPDLQSAAAIVAPDEGCRPFVQERFAAWAERVQYWRMAAEQAAVEREVMGLVAQLLGGQAGAAGSPGGAAA